MAGAGALRCLHLTDSPADPGYLEEPRRIMCSVQGLSDVGIEAFNALTRIYPDVVVTRPYHSPWLAGDSGSHVLLKMESEQAGRLYLPAISAW